MLPRPLRSIAFGVTLTVFSATTAFAQQVVVQQPIVGVSSVRTTVTVPDRGQIILGGVATAESSRNQFGFAPRGSSLGRSLTSRSSSATVRIIDLREMDEAILRNVEEPLRRSVFQTGRNGSTRFEKPGNENSGFVFRNSSRSTETRRSPADESARLETLAQHAEERGQAGVAKLHREAAARQRAQSR